MTSAEPAWLPDPADPAVIRYWDGTRYTAERRWDGVAWVDHVPGWAQAPDGTWHPSPATPGDPRGFVPGPWPAGPGAAPGWSPASYGDGALAAPASGGTPPRGIAVVVAITLAALLGVGALVAAVVLVDTGHAPSAPSSNAGHPSLPSGGPSPPSSTVPPDPCVESPPAGASPQAVAYLQATNAALPGWLQVTQMLQADGGADTASIIQLQIQIDSAFLGRLHAIAFSGAATRPAQALEADVSGYINALQVIEPTDGQATQAQDDAITDASNARSDASTTLRTTMGLPPALCSVLRP